MTDLLKLILSGVIGGSFGLLAAAGVFTVFVAVGMIPRFAGKTHTAKYIRIYEDMVISGTIIGGTGSVFIRYFQLGTFLADMGCSQELIKTGGNIFTGVFGLFAGWVIIKAKSIIPGMIMHLMWNTVIFFLPVLASNIANAI